MSDVTASNNTALEIIQASEIIAYPEVGMYPRIVVQQSREMDRGRRGIYGGQERRELGQVHKTITSQTLTQSINSTIP